MTTKEEMLTKWIPYRLEAIETLNFAWNLARKSQSNSQIKVIVDEKITMTGNLALITNPMIESGFIHARSLLEFMGLHCDKTKGTLTQIIKRKKDDIAIENFSSKKGPLSKVTPEDVYRSYLGPKEDVENAFLLIFTLANKELAHITSGSPLGHLTDDHLDIAIRGIPTLISNHLYTKLGMEMPTTGKLITN